MKLSGSNQNDIVADNMEVYAVVCYMDFPLVYAIEYLEMDSPDSGLCVWQTLCYQRPKG